MNNFCKWLGLPLILTLVLTGLYYWSYQRLLTGQDQSQYQLTQQQIKQNLKRTPALNASQAKHAPAITTASTGDLLAARTHFSQLVASQGIGELAIPQVAIKLPIFSTPTMATLSAGVARYFPQRPLGAQGNQVLIAHNFAGADVLLQRIDRLPAGAQLYVTNQAKVYDYQVQQNLVVKQTQTAVLANTNTANKLNLIRCEGGPQTPWRRVVVGQLVAQHPITTTQRRNSGPVINPTSGANQTSVAIVSTRFQQLTRFVSRHVFNSAWLISLLGLLVLSWWIGIYGYLRTSIRLKRSARN